MICMDFINPCHLHPRSHLQVLPPCHLIKNPFIKTDQGGVNVTTMPLQVYSRWNQCRLDQMQAQEFEPKPSNEHRNSSNFVSNVISPASNLLPLLETPYQFIQNKDSKVFPDLHLPLVLRKANKKCEQHPVFNFISFENLFFILFYR